MVRKSELLYVPPATTSTEKLSIHSQGTYALSEPVVALDHFVSHSWRTPRLRKFATLLLYFNFSTAVVSGVRKLRTAREDCYRGALIPRQAGC